MASDAAPGVAADVRAGATLPTLLEVAVALLVIGAIVLAGGTALLVTVAAGAHRRPPGGPEVPAPRGPDTAPAAHRAGTSGVGPQL